MVTTRGQKSSAAPAAVNEPKTRAEAKIRKEVAPSNPKSDDSVEKSRNRGRKRPVFSDDAAALTPRQSKRNRNKRAASSPPTAPQEEPAAISTSLSSSPTPEPAKNHSPAIKANRNETVAAEIAPYDPSTPEAAAGGSHLVEASSSTPSPLDAPIDDPASSSDDLSISLSDDEDTLDFLRSSAIEGHIHRLLYYDTTQEQDVAHDTKIELTLKKLGHLQESAMFVLHTIAKALPSEVMTMVADTQSTFYQELHIAHAEFVKSRFLLSKKHTLLNAHELGLVLPEQDIAIVRANLASFLSGFFDKEGLGYCSLNEEFLPMLVADGVLTKDKQDLLLDLKSHTFVSGLKSGLAKEDLLEQLFGTNFKKQLRANGGDASVQTTDNTDVIARYERRCAYLLRVSHKEGGLAVLEKKFMWKSYLAGLSRWMKENFLTLTGKSFEAQGKVDNNLVDMELIKPFEGQGATSSKTVGEAENTHAHTMSNEDEIAEKAARAADLVMLDFGTQSTISPIQRPYQQIQFQQPFQQNGYYVFDNSNQAPVPQTNTQSGQTETSLHTQYQQARLRATARGSPMVRRPSTPSSRRPWTSEEEAALMKGLDELGPHWSQILALHGSEGTESKVLKDRNQVQLKDKARNLKLWFLKQGKPVPESLSQVTGELKTRAPSVASRQNNGQSYQPQASSPLAARGAAAVGHPSTNITPHSNQNTTPTLHQTASSSSSHNVVNATSAETGLTGSDADLEAALAAAERAGLESS